MESVKSSVAAFLLQQYGPGCVLELDTSDRCLKIELPLSRDHVIYVRPDDKEQHFLCHYAHKADLVGDHEWEMNGDMLTWKQQNAAQLPRRVKGPLRDFTRAVRWYVPQAAERIDLMKGLGGRREAVVETFNEVKARVYHCPMPKLSDEMEEQILNREAVAKKRFKKR
jgi:hypothetical protein